MGTQKYVNILMMSTKNNADSDEQYWYVLRFLYRNQPKVRMQLENDGIETFSPRKPIIKIENGKRVIKWELVIWDLFFVHSTRKILDSYIRRYDNFQYKFKSGGKQHEPLIVPERQMNDFIKAVEISAKPLFFAPHELNLSKGERIRLIGGLLNGYEGTFLKVNGARQKRLIVELQGALCVAVEVNPDLIERLK